MMERTLDTLDIVIGTTAKLLGYLIIAFILLLVIGSLIPKREPGSLDDLDAITIRKVVDGGVGE